jgi:sulfur carrier protein
VTAPVTIRVNVNGADVDVPAETTVAELVSAGTDSDRGIAVAVNRQLVPRSTWPATPVAAGDRVEILTASSGG